MASVSTVEDALAALVTATLYPTGSPPSVVGYPVKVYAGWPDPATLDADMVETAGKPAAAHVSIYPLPVERNVTRYPGDRRDNTLPAATYTLMTNGQAITVGGSAPSPYSPQNLGVLVNDVAYVAQASAGQTPAQIAAALQALIVAGVAGTTVAGSTITLPAGARIQELRIGVTGSTSREVRRQERQFQIAVWSSNPASRALIADTLDAVLADTPWLSLANGEAGRTIYHGSREDDFTQKQRIWRRSLTFTVEYPTTIVEPATQIVVAEAILTDFQFEDVTGAVIFELDADNPDNAIWPALH